MVFAAGEPPGPAPRPTYVPHPHPAESARHPGSTRPPGRARLLPALWIVVTALGAGLTTWAVFLYLGIRARHRRWLAWAAVYAVLMVAFGVLESIPASIGPSLAPIPMLLAWFGGIGHVSAISKSAVRRMKEAGADAPALDAARERIARRLEGRNLAGKDPELARELGVGRPDLPGADDYGLVDVNHVPPGVLARLPGITPDLAGRIARTRQDVGGFSSAEDLCVTLDLPPALTDDLRGHTIFL